MAHLIPPFTRATAQQKVKIAQALWNTKDPVRVARAYTPDSVWRNRDSFVQGTAEIERFLAAKWAAERDYVLRKELFAFGDNRIAVQFWYEWRNAAGQWHRTYGLEHWTFAADGAMAKRQMSGNDVPIAPEERWFNEGVDVDAVEIGPSHW
ncbi:uncharacterized protein V1510DRAFT_412199 [Dipodascopsis tothii]|uniref:uncharacterized protein n=1 Tax=Dipodascopsis tothii TaxID=44089 RepID=UPI0034CF5317